MTSNHRVTTAEQFEKKIELKKSQEIKKKQQLRNTRKQGSVLILVVGLFAIFMVLFLALSSLALRTSNDTILDINRQQAFLNAKSVLQAFVDEAIEDPDILNNLQNFPITTEAIISDETTSHTVQLQIKTVDNNSNKLEITATGEVNDQIGTLSAVFERSSSGGSENKWIVDNLGAFNYVIASMEPINDFSAPKDDRFLTIDGSIYAKNGFDGQTNNYFITKDLVINESAGLYLNKSTIVGNLFSTKVGQIHLKQSAIAGGLYQFNTSISGVMLVKSVVYGDFAMRFGTPNFGGSSEAYVGGKSDISVPEWADLYQGSDLRKSVENYKAVMRGEISTICNPTCSTTTLRKSPQALVIPSTPVAPKRDIEFPANFNQNPFTCQGNSKCTLGTIDARNGAVYIEVNDNIMRRLSENSGRKVFDYDISSRILGDNDVVFVFNTSEHINVTTPKIGYHGTQQDRNNIYFLFNSARNHEVRLYSDFRGYIYGNRATVFLNNNVNGAVNSHRVFICDGTSDWCSKNVPSSKVVTYKNPATTEKQDFRFIGYK